MSGIFTHPRFKYLDPIAEVVEIAAETGYRRAQAALRKRRRAGVTRRPGADTPLWNVLAAELRRALRTHGAKVRLARYLGIPKQRINDFVTGRARLPDAELTLRMIHWLTAKQNARDISL